MIAVVAFAIAAPAVVQGSPPAKNRPLVVTTSLPDPPFVTAGDVLRFEITVSDPDGDKVSARLIQAPPGRAATPLTTPELGNEAEIAE